MSILDPEAAQLLRRAIQLGDTGRTTIENLRTAVEHPAPVELPPSRLRGDAPLARVLRRAMDLAKGRGVEMVGRRDLLEALAEAEAVAAGVDLDRLRFVRYCFDRAHGDAKLALRQYGQGLTTPSEEGIA